jgi:hypothetical protein
LDGCARFKEKGLCSSRNLGSVVYVDDEVSTSCALYIREVRSLRLDVLRNCFANDPAQTSP